MPALVTWKATYLGSLCGQSVEVDETGGARTNGGCEQREDEPTSRRLTRTEQDRLVTALDRLRTLQSGRANPDEARCAQGVTVRVVERSGAKLAWAFCRGAGTQLMGVDDAFEGTPEEVRQLRDALDSEK
jgi:hypothetical protein